MSDDTGNSTGNLNTRTERDQQNVRNFLKLLGSPNGDRTRVSGVRGRYPRPLDDGTRIKSLSDFIKRLPTIVPPIGRGSGKADGRLPPLNICHIKKWIGEAIGGRN
jgi:hypothetical protein